MMSRTYRTNAHTWINSEVYSMKQQIKMKKCKVCKEKFVQFDSLTQVCSLDCAIKAGKDNKLQEKVSRELARLARAEQKKKKEALKTKREWNAEAQSAINRYVRARDYYYPCISCGRYVEQKYGGNYDCGHYRTRKAATHLRFNLHNMAKQCVYCNRYKSGAQLDFREGLIKRIGIEKVEALENNNKIIKFDIEYLKRVKLIFTKKAKKLEKRIKAKGSDNVI